MVPGLLAGPIGTAVVYDQHESAKGHEWLTIGEVAFILRLNASTIREAIASGRLPAYRVGERSIRIRRSDLSSMIQPVNPGEEIDE